eukprot:gene909-4170_t
MATACATGEANDTRTAHRKPSLQKSGSLAQLLGQERWMSEGLKAMQPGSKGFQTEHRVGSRRRRSSFLKTMADFLAYSSTLDSNSNRPHCPPPQVSDDDSGEEGYLASTVENEVLDSYQDHIPLIVDHTTSVTPPSPSYAIDPPAIFRPEPHSLTSQTISHSPTAFTNDGMSSQNYLDDSESSTFVPLGNESSPDINESLQISNQSNDQVLKTTFPDKRDRTRRASVPTPCCTIVEEDQEAINVRYEHRSVSPFNTDMYDWQKDSILPNDENCRLGSRGKRCDAGTSPFCGDDSLANSKVPKAFAVVQNDNSPSPSSLDLVALQQLYMQLHIEQEQLLDEAREWRWAEVVVATALATLISTVLVKYIV